MIRAMIATTIKIPKPIPALKIPSTTPHELNKMQMIVIKNMLSEFLMFFIFYKRRP